MRDIVESWLWQDPARIIDRLMRRSDTVSLPRRPQEQPSPAKDRYYTQARRIEIQNSMKRVTRGKR